MSIKFDKFNLSIPIGDIVSFNFDMMEKTDHQKEYVTYKYIQKEPYEFFIYYTKGEDNVYIEFTGKALLDFYPKLISHDTIEKCFYNINSLGVCNFNISKALRDATVNKCDVTCDIKSKIPVSELYDNLSFTNNQIYSLEYLNRQDKSRFAIKSTHTTLRSKERLAIYDKEKEMKSAHGTTFLPYVHNKEEQLKYFEENPIRMELNLNSTETIRKFFKIKEKGEILLSKLLNSQEDPIGSFLNKAIRPYNYQLTQITQFGSPKEIKNLLYIALFQYNMEALEKHLRTISDKKCSIKKKMEPYNKIYDIIRPILNDPVTNFALCKVSEEIISSLYSILEGTKPTNPKVNLINLYNSQNPQTTAIEMNPLF